jgi:hypothetical protein
MLQRHLAAVSLTLIPKALVEAPADGLIDLLLYGSPDEHRPGWWHKNSAVKFLNSTVRRLSWRSIF